MRQQIYTKADTCICITCIYLHLPCCHCCCMGKISYHFIRRYVHLTGADLSGFSCPLRSRTGRISFHSILLLFLICHIFLISVVFYKKSSLVKKRQPEGCQYGERKSHHPFHRLNAIHPFTINMSFLSQDSKLLISFLFRDCYIYKLNCSFYHRHIII